MLRCKAGILLAPSRNAESCVGFRDDGDLVILTVLFGEAFAEIEGDLAGGALEISKAGIGFAEHEKEGAGVLEQFRNPRLTGAQEHDEGGGILFRDRRQGLILDDEPAGTGGVIDGGGNAEAGDQVGIEVDERGVLADDFGLGADGASGGDHFRKSSLLVGK